MVFKLPKIFSSYGDWLEKQQTSILSAATIILVANIVSSASGLIRSRLLLYHFFGSAPTQKAAYEAFLVAFQVPDTMFQLIVLGAVSAAFIPVFSSYKNNKEEELTYMNSMMNSVLAIFLIVGAFIFVFAEPFTRFRTGAAFTPEQLAITANMTRIMIGAQFFFAISNFLTGMLQSYKRFIIPAIAPVLYNLGILFGAYAFSNQFGIYAAGIGVIIGAFLHMVVQIPLAYKLGYRFQFKLSFRHQGVRTTYKLTPARTITLAISQFQDLATGFFTTSIGNLSFLIMNLASSLMTMPIRFFGVPIGQAALPFLSDEADEKDLFRFRDLVVKSLHQISFFAFPASILLLILRIPIVRIAYGTPNFPWATTLLTGRVVAIISISIAAQAIVQLLMRAFHALKDTRVPLYIAVISAVVYLAMSWFFVFVFKAGVLGLAIATSVSTILEMILTLYFLDLRVKGIISKALLLPQAKMLVASFFMAVFLYLPFRILDELVFDTSKTGELILLTITTGTIGTLVYIYFATLFDVEELYIIQSIFDKFGNWKKTLAKSQEVILESSIDGGDEV
jgi:putative peptidoglycan lipid II flippase